MCGLVGMMGDIFTPEKAAFKDMLDVCQVRGRHSTGVVKVDDKLDYNWVKQVGPPAYLFDSKRYDEVVERGPAKVLVGHCRHKTVGDISIKTCHPFDFEDEGICGVHNGTLTNYRTLDTFAAGKVDSEVLYGHLAKNGPEETFNSIEGAWACIWWDDNTKRLNFIRNNQRPLYFTWSKDMRTLFWASEPWMFNVLERKAGITLWEGTKDTESIISLPVNHHWSFSINPKPSSKSRVRMHTTRIIEPKPITSMGYESAWQRSRNQSRNVNKKEMEAKTAANGWVWDSELKKHVRVDDDKKKGGEVSNPFQIENDPRMNDELPLCLRPPTDGQEEKTNTKSSAETSTTSSKDSSESSKPQKSGKPSSSATTSSDQQSSSSSRKTNRKKLFVVSGTQQDKLLNNSDSVSHNGAPKDKASVRVVAGMTYITDGKTGMEFLESQFKKNTGNKCCHCKQEPKSLEEVSEFFGAKRFICVPCVTPQSVRKVS